MWPFGRRTSSKVVSAFGQTLSSYPLDAQGVPAALGEMRGRLFDMEGHTIEGIFRVSPSATDLQTNRQHAEAGQVAKIHDMASLAHIIKLWFRECLHRVNIKPPNPQNCLCGNQRLGLPCAPAVLHIGELPESLFKPCLQSIVDGPPRDAAACAALVQEMPEPNRSTALWLCTLLQDIARHEDSNRMTHKSLSIVFAPNVVDPPQSMPPMLALELNHRVVAFLERLLEAGSHADAM